MIEMTKSLVHFLWKYYPVKLPFIGINPTEMTEKMWEEYIEWCKTDEGREYLKREENDNG